MTPEQALQFFRHWTMEVMPVKHLDQFNQAFRALEKVIADAQSQKEPKSAP